MSNKQSSEFGIAVVVLVGVAVLIGAVYFMTAARFAAVSEAAGTREEIAARIAPVGNVTMTQPGAGTTAVAASAAPAAVAAPAAAGPGESVYSKTCMACHATGAAGAPKLGDAAAWGPRVSKGMDELMHTVLNGKGAMPPRGTCAACSESDLRAAVEYMLSQVP